MKSVTAIIPAYNEAQRIGNTISKIRPYVDEIIVIDDGSIDNTALEAEKAGAYLIRLPHNQGYIAAIKKGFSKANSDYVLTIDADGEFPTEQIPSLLQPLIDGKADMVQGRRNIIPRPSERLLTWLASRKGNVGDSGTGFRALKTDLAQKLALRGACICGIFSLEVLLKQGRIAEIQIQLNTVNKPRRIAWYHFQQIFFVLPWLTKKFED